STLHTNDSPSAITRLVDIGVEPFLISSSVLAVFAQRLVRVLCRECKQPTSPKTVYLQSIGVRPQQFADATIFKAVGCEKCFQTGYRGRIGIFEIMLMSEELRGLILQTFDSNRIKAQAIQEKMMTLRQDGIQKVLEGTTTIEEVLRVTQG
ncbi:MAG: Flp pilus assembly complex ATPase component TadA, partial [Desulfobacterales bacterium]|nr:Flp pilus assembly complex ATPase component TadA [Desulfobacterales bacterium]